jgi:hypothetical protein
MIETMTEAAAGYRTAPRLLAFSQRYLWILMAYPVTSAASTSGFRATIILSPIPISNNPRFVA